MNRRDFLKGLLATTALSATPIALTALVDESVLTGVVRNHHFLLHKPMRIVDVGVRVEDCIFECAPDFVGDYMLIMDSYVMAILNNCHFINKTTTQLDAVIRVLPNA